MPAFGGRDLDCRFDDCQFFPPPSPPRTEFDPICYYNCLKRGKSILVCPFFAAAGAGLCGTGVTLSRTGLVLRSQVGNCAKGGVALCHLMFYSQCKPECTKCVE